MFYKTRLSWHLEKFYRKSLSQSYLTKMVNAGKRARLKPAQTAQWIMAIEYKKGTIKHQSITFTGMIAISKGLKRIIAEDNILKSINMMNDNEQREAYYTKNTYHQFIANLKKGIYQDAPSRHDSNNFNSIHTG